MDSPNVMFVASETPFASGVTSTRLFVLSNDTVNVNEFVCVGFTFCTPRKYLRPGCNGGMDVNVKTLVPFTVPKSNV